MENKRKRYLLLLTLAFCIINPASAERQWDIFANVPAENTPLNLEPYTGKDTNLKIIPRTEYKAESGAKDIELPKLPALGPAGVSFTDPAFGCRILRVTSGEKTGISFFTPASSWQNTWNSTSELFYVRSQQGDYPIFKFDPAGFKVSRLADPNNKTAQLALKFRHDPNFSFTDRNIIYGVNRTGDLVECDISKGEQKRIVELKQYAATFEGEDNDDVSCSETGEVVVAFNGPGQDRLRSVIWVKKETTGDNKIQVMDVISATIDGKPAGFPPGKGVHHASVAKGGRYVHVVIQGVGNLIWDTTTSNCNVIKESGAHGAAGYGLWVSHATLPGNTGQGWMIRPMDTAGLNSPRPALSNPPKFWGDSHPSWNNASAAVNVPFVTSVYDQHYYHGDTKLTMPLGAIVAVSTDGSGRLWRFAHHRSVVNVGNSLSGAVDFWSTPRGNVSQDGRYFLFDSNWEDTLGKDPRGGFRKDIFIVELK